MFVHLSHILDPADMAFPGEPVLEVKQDSEIGKNGKPFASVLMHLPNHFGTHMDGPSHFNPEGKDFLSLGMDYFAYQGEQVLVVDLPEKAVADAIIEKTDLEPFAEQISQVRLLLIRTGFERYRKTDPHFYQQHGPCLHPNLTKWLNLDFPELRCIGMDWLSIASPQNDLGPEAHRWLLGNYTDHIITGIEDMALAALKDYKINYLTLGPLRTKGVDSCQICAIANVSD